MTVIDLMKTVATGKNKSCEEDGVEPRLWVGFGILLGILMGCLAKLMSWAYAYVM